MTQNFKTKEIRGTKTVAQKLKAARKKLELSLENAEQETNIRLKYLGAFESNNFEIFPSEVYAIGFLRRYAAFLGLNPDNIVTQYKIEWNAASSLIPGRIEEGLSPKSSMPRFDISITPKTIAVIAIITVVLGLFVYIWWSVQKFSAPPSLLISKPTSNQIIKNDKLVVEGKTDPGTYVFINNEPINVGQNGKFSQEVKLSQGMTILQVMAKNRLDRRSIHVIKVVDENKKKN